MSHQYLNEKIHNKKISYSLYFLLIFPNNQTYLRSKKSKKKNYCTLKKNIYIYICRTFMNQRTQEESCWPNTTIFENILQSTIVFEICRDLPLIENSSLGKSSFPWYSSSMNSSFIKNSTANLKAIFSKNSSFWNSSYTINSSFANSNFKKVVDR